MSRDDPNSRHVLSALVQNQPGVLAHVSGMLASRNFNIHSLAVGETENPELSRMTFVVHGDERTIDQVRKQLEKIVTVVDVDDYRSVPIVERDLLLVQLQVEIAQRADIRHIVEIFRGKIVDIGANTMILEVSGTEDKVEAFIDLIRPYKILGLARTGRIALPRAGTDASLVKAPSGSG